MTSLEWILSVMLGALAVFSVWLGREYRMVKQAMQLEPESFSSMFPRPFQETPDASHREAQNNHSLTDSFLQQSSPQEASSLPFVMDGICRHLIDHDHAIMVSMAGVAECTTEASMSILDVAKRLSTNTVELSQCLVKIHDQSHLMREEIIMASAAVVKAAGLLLQMPDKVASIDKTEPLVTRMIDSIQALEAHHASIFGYFDAELKTVASRYENISGDLSELFGRIQFEDVVKQKIQRAMAALEFRELLFRDCMKELPAEKIHTTFLKLHDALKDNMNAYLAAESYHAAAGQSDRDLSANADQPKIELF